MPMSRTSTRLPRLAKDHGPIARAVGAEHRQGGNARDAGFGSVPRRFEQLSMCIGWPDGTRDAFIRKETTMFSARLWRWAAAGALTPIGIAALLLGVLAIAAPVRADIRPVVQQSNANFGQGIGLTQVGNLRFLAVSQASPARVDIFKSDAASDESNVWSPETVLTPANPANTTFGQTLVFRAGSDGTLLLAVGGYLMQEVMLYRRSTDGSWSFEQQLPGSVLPYTAGGFGNAIAISPDLRTIAVGSAESLQLPGGRFVGAVALFRRVGGTFQFAGNLTQGIPVPAGVDTLIGSSVAFADLAPGEKPELLVGAIGLGTAGQVLVFRENAPGTWTRIKTLAPPARIGDAYFGAPLQCSGSAAIAGQGYAGFTSGGSAWALRRVQGNWSIASELPRPQSVSAYFLYGHSVAIEGNMAAVGSLDGYVQLFRRLANGAWIPHDLVFAAPADLAGNAAAAIRFGNAIALRGGVLAVSAPDYDFAAFTNAGNVSLIEVGSTTFLTPDRSSYGYFGHAVAMSGNRCAISSPTAVTSFSGSEPVKGGSVRVMEFVGGAWAEEVVLRSDRDDGGFGTAVAMPDADTVVVTEPGFLSGPTSLTGRVLIYRRISPGNWLRRTYVPDPAPIGSGPTYFGSSVAAIRVGSDLLIAVGVPSDSSGSTPRSGSVALLRVTALSIFPSALFAATPATDESFGRSVALERYPDGSVDLCVGAGQRSRNGVANVGALDLFRWRPGDALYQFTYKQSFVPPGVGEGDIVGYLPNALSMRGSLLVVGVPIGETPPSVGQGFARAYRRSPNGTWTLLGGVMRGLNASSIDTASGVSTNGTLIAVSRPGNNEVALYRAVGSGVQYVRSVRRPSPVRNSFGSAIAMGAGLNPAMLIGAPTEDVGDLDWAGSAFYFGGAFGP